MDVRIHAERCTGTGYCGRVAPRLFHVEDGRVQRTRTPVDDDREAAEEAALLCPTETIEVIR